MVIDIVWLVVGLALILFGANWLTDGASAVARRMGVSDLVIGLTVVALGTSTPELAISVISAISGNAPLAVGNVVGSNIFNVLVIIGAVALIHPVKVKRSILVNEIPMMLMATCMLLVMGLSPLLDGAGERVLTRTDGIILLLLFMIFMRITFASARRTPADAVAKEPLDAEGASRKSMGTVKAVALIMAGLAALVYGGDRFVAGASGLASRMGVSDAVIGLTIVAAGTSLPELAASLVAAIKGRTGMAVGNVIGSNIFNIFLILGLASTIRPLTFGGVTDTDLMVMTAAAFAFWIAGWVIGHRTITRIEGLVLLLGYVAYTALLVVSL